MQVLTSEQIHITAMSIQPILTVVYLDFTESPSFNAYNFAFIYTSNTVYSIMQRQKDINYNNIFFAKFVYKKYDKMLQTELKK